MDELTSRLLAGSLRTGQLGQEETWLDELARHTLSLLAGRILTSGQPAEPDRQEDTRPVAPSYHLARMLGQDHPEMLPEWLERVEARQWRCPTGWLAPLLDWGKRQPRHRSLLVRVGGPRAQWLARQNLSSWGYLVIDEDWHTAGREARLDWLLGTRADHPGRARETLQSTWEKESAPDREAFLQTLATGLSPEDEEFLESCLNDRARGVRAAAAVLLSGLPQSQFAQRFRQRLQSWGYNPPLQWEEDLLRDGVEPKPPQGIGQRAFWLQQALALAPLGPIENSRLGSPEWQEARHQGWAQAALRQKRPDWARWLLDRGLNGGPLVGLLEPQQQASWIEQNLHRLQNDWLPEVGCWNLPLAQKVLERACQEPERFDFAGLGRYLPPGLELPPGDHLRPRQREPFYYYQSFRKTMYEEIGP